VSLRQAFDFCVLGVFVVYVVIFTPIPCATSRTKRTSSKSDYDVTSANKWLSSTLYDARIPLNTRNSLTCCVHICSWRNVSCRVVRVWSRCTGWHSWLVQICTLWNCTRYYCSIPVL